MASIASVYVDILPTTGKIADGIKRALLDADSDVVRAAKRWKREIEAELKGAEVKVDADTAPAKEIKKVEDGRYEAKVRVESRPGQSRQGPRTDRWRWWWSRGDSPAVAGSITGRIPNGIPPIGHADSCPHASRQISRVSRTLASLPREPIWQGIKRDYFVVRCVFESSH